MGKYLDMANEVLGLQSQNRGRLMEFDSPVFGRCYGRIQMVKGTVYHITKHSVLEREVTIPGNWLVRVLNEDAGTQETN